MPDAQTAPTPPANLPLDARAVALAHLALRGARELNQLVAETHATIAQTPLPLPSAAHAPARQAPLAYKLVGHSFLLLARWARALLQPERLAQLTAAEEGLAWQRFQGALNGVCGDTLVHWKNPLASGISLRDGQGRQLSSASWPGQARHALLFIHGLCLTEREWDSPAHQAYVAELETKGWAVAYLRYNTGAAIAHSGRELDRLLRQLKLTGNARLHLIGHSMGGLVIRAACHSAQADQADWLKQLGSVVYLGSPHLGSVWERLGERANNLLALTPYTRPFMRLGPCVARLSSTSCARCASARGYFCASATSTLITPLAISENSSLLASSSSSCLVM